MKKSIRQSNNKGLRQHGFIKPPGFSQSKSIVKVFVTKREKEKKRNFLYWNLISRYHFFAVLDFLIGFRS